MLRLAQGQDAGLARRAGSGGGYSSDQCVAAGVGTPAARPEHTRRIQGLLYQPSKRLTHYGPVASANGGDASGLGSEAAPSVLAGVENGLVARKHAIGEEVLAQILPDVLLCVELRALGRQR